VRVLEFQILVNRLQQNLADLKKKPFCKKYHQDMPIFDFTCHVQEYFSISEKASPGKWLI